MFFFHQNSLKRSKFHCLNFPSVMNFDGPRSDREIVLAAVQQHGRSLQHADGDAKTDPEVVEVGGSEMGWAMRNNSSHFGDTG